MSRCKYCGALIDWIRTPQGKYMPVEYRPALIMPDRGDEVFITDEGEAIQGKRALPNAVGGGNIAAYIPHWATCSARKQNSKKKEFILGYTEGVIAVSGPGRAALPLSGERGKAQGRVRKASSYGKQCVSL